MNTEPVKNFLKNPYLWILVVLLFWFGYAINIISPALQENLTVGYALFLLVYGLLAYKLILNEDNDLKTFAAFLFVLLVWDLMSFPYLVTKEGLAISDGSPAKISSEIWIYQMLPSDLPAPIKYVVIYIVVVFVLIVAASKLTGKDPKEALRF